PGFELGNNYHIDTSQFPNPKDLARHRLNKLLDPQVGFYTKSTLPNQLFVLPRSISDTSGDVFIGMLKEIVSQMYPSDSYEPEIIVYEDKFKHGTDYVAVGKHIINAVSAKYNKHSQGYGVVMIP